jgi:hypothetical protein
VDKLTVVRWRRYGKDRLYVNAPDGTRVGWVCLLTGEGMVEAPDHRTAFDAAIAAWRTQHPEATTETASSETVPTPPVARTDHPAWVDLAANRPGTAAQQQEVLRREAAPARTAFARVLRVHTDERAWRIGAKGEEKVGAQLARLDARWMTLHAVPVGDRGADIDHLVIGPGGVFTLNAKHHPGANIWVAGDAVMINGRQVEYVRNSRTEAARAERLLSAACCFPVAVTGMIVPVGAQDIVIRELPADVQIVIRRRVASFLGRLPRALDAATVDVIYAAARRSDTWQRPSIPVERTDRRR